MFALDRRGQNLFAAEAATLRRLRRDVLLDRVEELIVGNFCQDRLFSCRHRRELTDNQEALQIHASPTFAGFGGAVLLQIAVHIQRRKLPGRPKRKERCRQTTKTDHRPDNRQIGRGIDTNRFGAKPAV